ncbi:hypothetical protein M513_12998 [Trichuris suis]|uniref:Sm domain-containing protein n=1 Tax=Trichuris suis TaxID=68888 RepID=A0A085LMD6_9BILA|nr:hypothetical protein M513_12998 [Trichuris suis]
MVSPEGFDRIDQYKDKLVSVITGDGRHILYDEGLSAAATAEKIQAVYGEETISDLAARKCFSRFREGSFDVSDSARSGRRSDFDEERLNALAHEDPRQSTLELSEKVGCGHVTVSRHLLPVGKVRKMGSRMPHHLSQDDKVRRVSAAGSLPTRCRQAVVPYRPSFSQIVTVDERWCLHVNTRQRKEWLNPGKDPTLRAKPNCTNERLCCPSSGIVRNQTIIATIYVDQFRRLASAVQQKRQRQQHPIMLQQVNPWSHTATITKTTIHELGWEGLPHLGYSSDLAPTDYYLFRSLVVKLRGVSLNNDEELQKWLSDFFNSKPPQFYRFRAGNLKGFDQTINLVLDEACERVYSKDQGIEQVQLGLYIIRGDNVAIIGEMDEEMDRRLDLTNTRADPLMPIWFS